jgi:hypothetical protein
MMKSKLILCSICVGLILMAGGPAAAQNDGEPSPANQLAIGGHFGQPTGLSMKLETTRHSYDLLLAWNLNNFFVAQSHLWLLERPFPQEPRLQYFAGPGLVIQATEGMLRTGFSAAAGLTFEYAPFEFFVQGAPLLNIVPSTQGDITAGAGFRIFL